MNVLLPHKARVERGQTEGDTDLPHYRPHHACTGLIAEVQQFCCPQQLHPN